MEAITTTPFSSIYDIFLGYITDDMYMELTELETFRLLEDLLLAAIHKFEFPHFDIFDFDTQEPDDQSTYCGVDSNNELVSCIIYGGGKFNAALTHEEQNIIAVYMVVQWLSQQLATIEQVRMKYTGSDFKFSSQANHLQKTLALKKDYEREGFHLQRVYCRHRVNAEGGYESTFDTVMEARPEGREVSRNAFKRWY